MESAAFVLRDERHLAHEQAFGFDQNALGRFEQTLAVLGRHHAARAAYQQRVAGQFAQLAQ